MYDINISYLLDIFKIFNYTTFGFEIEGSNSNKLQLPNFINT